MRAIRITIEVVSIAIVALCAAALLVFTLPATGWKALNVATGSMAPAIVPGSLVIVHRVPDSSLKVGDVITYKSSRNVNETITHRIVKTTTIGSNHIPAFVTKGDANQVADSEIAGGSVVGQVIWHVPTVGRLTSSVRRPWVVLVLVAIPGLLVIIFELRRLVRVLSRGKGEAETGSDGGAGVAADAGSEPPAPRVAPAPLRVAPVDSPPPTRVARPPRRRGVDGLVRGVVALAVGAALLVSVGSTHALLNSSASLTNNRIGSATTTNHLLINSITLGAGNVCGQSTGTLTISNTGPGSTATINVHSSCTVTSTNSSSVNASTSSNQTATSGSASSSGNTSGGGATSGSASNTSNSSTSVTVGGGSGATGSPAAVVQLYNPAAAAVTLSGWQLESASASQTFGATLTIPAHGSLAVAYSAQTLSAAGGRLLLLAPGGGTVDAVSWGSDTSQLNPAAPAIGPSGELERKALGFDTDTAADWQTQ